MLGTVLLLTVVQFLIAVCTADYSIYETTVGGTLDGDSHYETHNSSRKELIFKMLKASLTSYLHI